MSNVHQQLNRSKPLQLQVTLGLKCSEKTTKKWLRRKEVICSLIILSGSAYCFALQSSTFRDERVQISFIQEIQRAYDNDSSAHQNPTTEKLVNELNKNCNKIIIHVA